MIKSKPTTILTILKAATANAHDTTEQVALVHKMKNLTLSKEEYTQLITCNWWIHQTVEKAVISFFAEHVTPTLSPFFDKKSEWLTKDLQTLKISPDNLSFSTITYPNIPTKAALIGALYVIEGSMLGGQFMLRLFRQNPALDTIPHFHFYQGYEKKTGQRWKTFQTLANQATWSSVEQEQAITQAKATFQLFQTVYQIGLPSKISMG